MSECQQKLRQQGKAYPRTCQICGLGPCKQATEYMTSAAERSESFWDMTVAHFANPDGSWPAQAYGAHEASHPVRVREAIAMALEKAPACADTIVALIWRNRILENRLANLGIPPEEATKN